MQILTLHFGVVQIIIQLSNKGWRRFNSHCVRCMHVTCGKVTPYYTTRWWQTVRVVPQCHLVNRIRFLTSRFIRLMVGHTYRLERIARLFAFPRVKPRQKIPTPKSHDIRSELWKEMVLTDINVQLGGFFKRDRDKSTVVRRRELIIVESFFLKSPIFTHPSVV